MSHTMELIKEDFLPATASATIGSLIYSFVWDQKLTDSVPLFNIDLPGWVAIGGTIFTSHLAGNVLQSNILPLIPNNNYVNAESGLLKPIIGGLSTYGLFMIGGNNPGFTKGFGLGAGSIIAGQYGYDYFMKK